MKIDIHCHILPESWPDLKEVSDSVTAFTVPKSASVMFLLCRLSLIFFLTFAGVPHFSLRLSFLPFRIFSDMAMADGSSFITTAR